MNPIENGNTVAEVFDRLNGPAAFARLLGLKASTASEMKRRKSIPVRYWAKLIAAARVQGVILTEAELVKLHGRSRRVADDFGA